MGFNRNALSTFATFYCGGWGLSFFLFLFLFFTSSLYVSSVLQVSDTGQYVCKVTNVAGQVDKNFHLNIYGSTLYLIINEKLCYFKQSLTLKNNLSPSSVPPSIDGPAEESVVETISNPATFACDATGIPPPSLIWLKNGRPIGTPVFKFK